jgi:CBS domain containing-hemolysin-like protein
MSASDQSAEAGGENDQSWLDRLLGRFGLSEQPDLRTLIQKLLAREDSGDANVSEHERIMLRNILEFGSLRVEDVMLPRADIIAIDDDATIADALAMFAEGGHSRLPIFHGTLDDPRGMLHLKDLVPWLVAEARRGGDDAADGKATPDLEQPDLGRIDLLRPLSDAGIARELLYVPASMSALDLLLRMQATRIHLALVIDEYGGVDGLVTLDDLIEEVMGEIEDEHDSEEEEWIREDPKLGLVADARTPLEDVEETLELSLVDDDDDDIETIGGLVVALSGHVPVKGEIVAHETGVEFEVLDADPRRVKRLRIHRPKSASPAADPAPRDPSASG